MRFAAVRTTVLRDRRYKHTRPLGALALAVIAPLAHAQRADAWVPAEGHGAVSAAYQQLYVRYHALSDGSKNIPGTIRDRSVFLGVDYGLTGRLALDVGIAYKSNRYHGRPHPVLPDDHDHDEPFIDDNRYHGGWADWNLGLRYQWRSEPWAITPYVGYGVPARDYPTYAHSAVGLGQKRTEVGVNLGHRFGPPLQNLYFQAGFGYAFMEVVDHRRVNHGTLSLELGWFLTPRLTGRVTVVGRKTQNGLEFPQDYPRGVDPEQQFHHDQNLRDDYINVGAGIDYRFNERYTGFANAGRSVWGENTHLVDYALTVGISRGF